MINLIKFYHIIQHFSKNSENPKFFYILAKIGRFLSKLGDWEIRANNGSLLFKSGVLEGILLLTTIGILRFFNRLIINKKRPLCILFLLVNNVYCDVQYTSIDKKIIIYLSLTTTAAICKINYIIIIIKSIRIISINATELELTTTLFANECWTI